MTDTQFIQAREIRRLRLILRKISEQANKAMREIEEDYVLQDTFHLEVLPRCPQTLNRTYQKMREIAAMASDRKGEC